MTTLQESTMTGDAWIIIIYTQRPTPGLSSIPFTQETISKEGCRAVQKPICNNNQSSLANAWKHALVIGLDRYAKHRTMQPK